MVGPIKSDSGGLSKVRRQLEWVERRDEEEEEAIVFQEILLRIFFSCEILKESKYYAMFTCRWVRPKRWMIEDCRITSWR